MWVFQAPGVPEIGGFFALLSSWAGVIETDNGIFVRPLHCLVKRICIEFMDKIISLINGYMEYALG